MGSKHNRKLLNNSQFVLFPYLKNDQVAFKLFYFVKICSRSSVFSKYLPKQIFWNKTRFWLNYIKLLFGYFYKGYI